MLARTHTHTQTGARRVKAGGGGVTPWGGGGGGEVSELRDSLSPAGLYFLLLLSVCVCVCVCVCVLSSRLSPVFGVAVSASWLCLYIHIFVSLHPQIRLNQYYQLTELVFVPVSASACVCVPQAHTHTCNKFLPIFLSFFSPSLAPVLASRPAFRNYSACGRSTNTPKLSNLPHTLGI